ncbi:MAG TPA: hypothetical protein VIM89_08520 [Mucilaginibacter sp.]
MSDKKKLIQGVLILVFSLFYFKSIGQNIQPKINRDSSKTITLAEFNQKVDRGILLLKTKPLAEISDSDHVNIMMCWNTIFMAMVKNGRYTIKYNGERLTFPKYKKRFSVGRYHKLEKMIDKIEYTVNLGKIYPEWSPSRGMGVYFDKLQMAIKGTPEPYAVFNVTQ